MNDDGTVWFLKSFWNCVRFCILFKISVAFLYLIYTGIWSKGHFLQSFEVYVSNLIFRKWFYVSKWLLASKPLKFLWFITIIFSSYFLNDPFCLFNTKTAFIIIWGEGGEENMFLLNWILKSLKQWCFHFSWNFAKLICILYTKQNHHVYIIS